MKSTTSRLDRFVSRATGIKRDAIKTLLAKGRIAVDGIPATDSQQLIHQFSLVVLEDQVLQANTARYLMLNKPAGVVSATKDTKHPTVINLLNDEEKNELHIVGRLDFNSTGLLLLTNDGRWSREINNPINEIEKVYRVKLEKPLNQRYVDAFAEGMYFAYENIYIRPVHCRIVSDYEAEVSLMEGRYHQIKRMFGRFQNKVLNLHRTAIGCLSLDPTLAFGQYRQLEAAEVKAAARMRSV